MKPIGQMEQLPLKVLNKIFSFCSVNDRAQCRLVSRVLKGAAEISLSSVTHLNIQRGPVGRPKWPKRVENGIPSSYSDEIFLHKPLVDVWVKSGVPKELFFFLGQYCPDLQVVSATSFSLEYEQLVQIASSLQFFHCMDIQIQSAFKGDLESLFAPFEQLKGFQVSDFSQKWVLFAKYLRMRERRMFTRKTPDGRIFLKMPLEFLDQVGISCLSIDLTHMVQQIPEALAECLVDLTVESNPPAQFCRCPLLKLRYLRLREQRVVAEPNPLFCRQLTPNLERFEFDGEVNMSSLSHLMSYIHSLEKLQYASLSPLESRDDDEDGQLVDSFPLPPKLTELRVEAILPFHNSSTSLRSLSMIQGQSSMKGRMFDFNFPNLEFFKCKSDGAKGMFGVFLQSLSKCCKLVTFRLKLKLEERADASQVQCLIDILQQNPGLTHLKLHLYTPFCGCNTLSPPEHTGKTVFLRQEHFPSLKRVGLILPYEIVFYPTDSFDRLETAPSTFDVQRLMLTSESLGTDFSLRGTPVIPVFSSQMDKLVNFKLDLTPDPQHALAFHSLASQLHKAKNLKILQCSYLPMMESSSQDSSQKHLFELQKIVHFFFAQNFKCLFTQTASNDDTSRQLSQRPTCRSSDFIFELVFGTIAFQVSLHEDFEKLVLRTERMSLDLSVLTSRTLSSLEIDGDISAPFDLPNLRHFCLEQRLKPPSLGLLDSLRKSPQLRTFQLSFEFDYRGIPDARFVNSLLQVTSQLKHLETLVLDVGHFSQQVTKKEEQVSLHQKNFPSLTKLVWNLPFHFTFHALDVFDSMRIGYKGCIFRNETPSLIYKLKAEERSVNIHLEPNVSKLVELRIGLHSFEQSGMTHIYRHPQDRIQSQSVFFDWAASLPHLLTLVTAPLPQADVERFLRNLRTTGPLTIYIGCDSQKVTRMDDQLHQLVSSLMASGVISSFKSTWTCKAEQFRRRTKRFAIASIPFCCPPLQH